MGKRSTLGYLTELVMLKPPMVMLNKPTASLDDTVFLEVRERAKGGERLSERRES